MIEVKLLSHSPDPLRRLYLAYRVATSALTPTQILERIDDGRITDEQMLKFVNTRLEVNHVSPLQQVTFEFGVSGVSRAFSHQFVRHHVGIDIEQQSQRYVVFTNGSFPYTVPPTVEQAGPVAQAYFTTVMTQARDSYRALINAGVPAEDARFVLPNAAHTNLKFTVNFTELQHIVDLRTCLRAQWEFRIVASKMRGEINRVLPWLGAHLAIKCMAQRLGYCDEDLASYQACPVARLRPHKSQVIP